MRERERERYIFALACDRSRSEISLQRLSGLR